MKVGVSYSSTTLVRVATREGEKFPATDPLKCKSPTILIEMEGDLDEEKMKGPNVRVQWGFV